MYLVLLLVICLGFSSLPAVCAIDQGLKLFLVEAALERNLEIVRWLVKKEAFIDVKDDNGFTPLMHASTMDDPTEVMQVLLAEGADADLRDDEGKTALHFASEIGNQGVVELLVAKMKNTSITDNKGRTALHHAVHSDNGDVLSYLLNQGLDSNAKDINGFTAFHTAAMIGKARMLEILKDREIELDSGTTNQDTPLMLASLFEQNEAAEYLIELGANVNSQDKNNWTALHLAAYNGNLKQVKLLVANNATLDIRNSDGQTPLHLATNNGHYAAVEYLTDKGANISITDNYNNTLLHGAAASGNIELLKNLTEMIHELDKINGLGYTPLIRAALEGKQDAVKFLIDAGADTGILKRLGVDFLLKALSANNTELLKSLKQIDIDFEFISRNSQGMTLLHYASRSSNIDTLKYLIDAMVKEMLNMIGSKIQVDQTLFIGTEICLPCFVNITNMKDSDGKTPLYHAAEWGNADAVEILLKYGTDQKNTDNNGLTAFHVAAKLGHTDVLKKLAPLNMNINIVDKQAKSAVFYSAQEGKLDSLRYLINFGADLTIKDSKSWSLLHAATANGHNEVVQELLLHKHFVSVINDVDEDDKPSSWYAMSLGHIDILETLELNGARIGQDHLCKAVENNNVEFVKYLTRKNGPQLQTTCYNNETTLLHIAATKGHVDLVKHLTKCSCLVNSLDKNGKSPLWYAIKEQKWDCAQELKGSVIQPLVSPLDAVKNNSIAFVKYFLKEGFNFPENSLHEAASRGYTDIAKELVKISTLINAYDNLDTTPLWYAVSNQKWDCAKVIKDVGGVIEPFVSPLDAVKNNSIAFVKYFLKEEFDFPENSLHEAASRGYTDIAKELVKIPTLINAYDNLNKTPLWYAVNKQKWDCAKVIKEVGGVIKPLVSPLDAVKNNLLAFVKYFIEEGLSFPKNSLHEAASRGYTDIAKELVKISTLINAYDNLNKTPLWYAVSNQKWDCAKVIKEVGGVIKPLVSPLDAVKNNFIGFVKYFVKEGFSFPYNSLHEAAARGYTDIAEELVKIPSLINVYYGYSKTPLWYAIEGEHWDIVDVLERAGGQVKPNYTIGDAVDYNNLAYVKYLIRKGVSVHSQYKNDCWPVVYASALFGHNDILEYLLDSGADIDDTNKASLDSVLMVASKSGRCDTVRLLLRRGASVNKVDKLGETALDLTWPECRQDLLNYGAKTSIELRG